MGWPKYLKKTYTKDELDKKVLKKLQLAHDREFLEGLFVSEKRGEWKLKADLSKEEAKRLKKLVKEIKKGKGGVKILPLVIILILVGGGVVFGLFFKNPLADRMMEESLEDLFGATSEVEGLNLSLFSMEVRWDNIAVADASKLDENLFELGETVIKMNTPALLQKKIVMDSLVCRDVGWGTARDVPGELVPPPGEGSEDASGDSAGDSSAGDGGKGLFDPENFRTEQTDTIASAVTDPGDFVNDQWDSLRTPALADELEVKYRNELDERETSFRDIRQESEQVADEGKAFLNRDYNQYKSNPAKIPELVQEGDAFYKEVDGTVGDVNRELKAIDELRASIKADKDALEDAKEEDMARVKSLVTIPEGGIRGMVDGMVQSYLYSLLGDKYLKAVKIAEFIKKYREDAEGEQAEEDQAGRIGRIVYFDTVIWPEILLREGVVSAGGSGFSWEAALGDIAADADQWEKPAAAHLDWNMGSGLLEGDGVWERRSDADSPSTGDFTFDGLPLSTDALSSLGISSAKGSTGGTAGLTIDADSSWAMVSDIVVKDPQMVKSGDGMVADAVYSVLSEEDWEMTLEASGDGGSDFSFKLSWPLLSRVDEQIGEVLREQAEEYLDDVQDELLDRYAGEYDFLDDYLGELDDWEALLKGDISSLDGVKSQVNDQIDEVKEEATSQATEKVEDVLESTGLGDKVDEVKDALPKLF